MDPRERGDGFDVVIVGAGSSGLYLLHRLRSLGFTAHAIEAGDDVGGTWYWNRYPGARCDIESMTYSYSFDEALQQEWTWTERYASQPEILRYLEHVASRFDLRRDITFSTRATRAVYGEPAARWTVETDRGATFGGRFLVLATGVLSAPRLPDVPGLARFRGEAYHTGLWPHEPVDFGGKRVAILGTGSSAVQALPVIAEAAAEVTVFQRTPPFSVPTWNGPLDAQAVRERKARYAEYRDRERRSAAGNPWFARQVSAHDEPPEQRRQEFESRYRIGGFFLHSAYADLFDDQAANDMLADFVREKIRERVRDPELAELLCPYDYPLGTKRMCIDTGYYEAYRRPNVRLVSVRDTPIEELTETGLRLADGRAFRFELLVLATGFDAMTGALLAIDIHGRDGRTLREAWADGPRCHLGLAFAGFPNLFTVTGPGSPSVLSNVLGSIEYHVEWITDCIDWLRRRNVPTIEPTAAAQEAWVDHVRALGEASLYPKARSWYMGSNVPGKPRVLLPYVGGVGRYRSEVDEIAANGYAGFALGTPDRVLEPVSESAAWSRAGERTDHFRNRCP